MKVKFFILVLLLANIILAQTPDTLWNRYFSFLPEVDEIGKDLIRTFDNGYLIVGTTENLQGYKDIYLIKTNNLGIPLWTKTYGGNLDDELNSAKLLPDGGFILTGRSSSLTGFQVYSYIMLYRTDSLGDTIWTKNFGSFENWSSGHSIDLCYDGGYIITGYTNFIGTETYDDLFLLKTDSLGNQEWFEILDAGYYEEGRVVYQLFDGNYIVWGTREELSQSYNMWLLKFDSFGDTIWTRTYGGTGAEEGYTLNLTQDGCFIAGGITSSYGAGQNDIWLLKIDFSGDTLWTKTYGGYYNDALYSVSQTLDKGFILGGSTNLIVGIPDIYIIRTDSMGDSLWSKTYGGMGTEICNKIIQLSNNFFSYTGLADTGSGNYDIFLSKIGFNNDVGPLYLISPKQFENPNNIQILAAISNYSEGLQNFNTRCIITDTVSKTVVKDTTVLSIIPGELFIIQPFGDFNFQNNNIYEIKIITMLGSDQDLSNDTIVQLIFCSSEGWQNLPSLSVPMSGLYGGYSFDRANTFIHVFGGIDTTLHYIFDISLNSWTEGNPLPYKARNGGYATVSDNIYLIGSEGDDIGGAQQYITVYNSSVDSFDSIVLPYSISDPAVTVKDERYIYIVGGSTTNDLIPSTSVMLYDIIDDSFYTQTTQLPAEYAVTKAGLGIISDDTLVLIGGITQSNGITDKVRHGKIDQGDPSNISWTTPSTSYPGGRVHSLGNESWNEVVILSGGQDGQQRGAMSSTYSYQANQGWRTHPDRPNPAHSFAFVSAPVDVVDLSEEVIYSIGGENADSLLSEFIFMNINFLTYIVEDPAFPSENYSFRLLTPNIIRDILKIEFVLPITSPITFCVYDITGREIYSSFYSEIHKGKNTLRWTCVDNKNIEVSSGIYIFRLESDIFTISNKIMIIK